MYVQFCLGNAAACSYLKNTVQKFDRGVYIKYTDCF